MRRKTIIVFATIAMLGVGVILAWPRNRRISPIHKIETLQNPVAVRNWNSDGLHLADGRTVQLPGLRSLPSDSPALAEATKRGVEVNADGRVWGLVRVHHWCGNDPVREHIARVDLADMMLFLRVGEPIADVPEAKFLVRVAGGRFSKWGWRIGEFLKFQSWESMKDSAQ